MPDLKTEEMVVQMGPQHPATHGVLRLEITTDGEVVRKINPHIGYLHRCFEKHCEELNYHQIIPFVDRCDYLAAMNNEHGYVMAVEKLLEIEIPERVEYIRVIMSELNRIASHLVSLGTYGLDIGAITPFLFTFRDREKILDLFEMTSGARLLYNYIWIGGVAFDLPNGFVEKCFEFIDYFLPKLKEYDDLLSYNKIFIKRTAEVAIIPPAVAIEWGITGPNLRASGVDWDLRRDEPYSIYDKFEWDVIVADGRVGVLGDSWSRYYVRVLEMEQSASIVKQALEGLPSDENVKSAVPKKVRPKEGSIFFRSENPRGELGYYISSDGSDIPYRLKMRSPAFCNLSAISDVGEGLLISDLVSLLGSIDIVLGEIDR